MSECVCVPCTLLLCMWCSMNAFSMLSCFISVNIFPSAPKHKMPRTSNREKDNKWERDTLVWVYESDVFRLCVSRRRFLNYDLNERTFYRKRMMTHMAVLCVCQSLLSSSASHSPSLCSCASGGNLFVGNKCVYSSLLLCLFQQIIFYQFCFRIQWIRELLSVVAGQCRLL